MNQLIKLLSPHKKQEGIFETRFLVVLGGVIFLIVAMGYFFYGLQPTLASDSDIELEVEKGESFRSIGAELSQRSLIRSIAVFKAYSLLTGKARSFKPGIYDLNTGMSVPEITNKLVEGGKTEVMVTIPEGVTVKDIDHLLAKSEIIEEGDIESYDISNDLRQDFPFLDQLNSLEGFLFPDTYKFSLESSADKVIRRFLNNFKNKAWPKIKDQNNWYDSLILASFLEREVKTQQDRRIVSGILLKRLQAGMPLQVDATVTYAKCLKTFLVCQDLTLTESDLEDSSPYNTYKRLGWTPTPISNPGVATLEAATNSVSTDYWYYLSDKDTEETIFSRNLEEHNINRSIHL